MKNLSIVLLALLSTTTQAAEVDAVRLANELGNLKWICTDETVVAETLLNQDMDDEEIVRATGAAGRIYKRCIAKAVMTIQDSKPNAEEIYQNLSDTDQVCTSEAENLADLVSALEGSETPDIDIEQIEKTKATYDQCEEKTTAVISRLLKKLAQS